MGGGAEGVLEGGHEQGQGRPGQRKERDLGMDGMSLTFLRCPAGGPRREGAGNRQSDDRPDRPDR